MTFVENGGAMAAAGHRTPKLAALGLASGTHQLTATVTDPAGGGGTQDVTRTVGDRSAL